MLLRSPHLEGVVVLTGEPDRGIERDEDAKAMKEDTTSEKKRSPSGDDDEDGNSWT